MTQAGARSDAIAAGGLLAVALFLGGGNWLYPLQRLVVELAAVLVLAWFCLRPWRMPAGIAAKCMIALLTATMLLLLVQLVPLPASIWHSLPGRGTQLALFTALGTADRSAPISFVPDGTRDTIAFFLVPLAMFVATMRLGRDLQKRLLQITAMFCVLNGLMVVMQFQGFSWLTLYSTYGRPGSGLFANKNHSAAFLVTAMPAVVWSIMNGWPDVAVTTRRWIATAATGFLSLTVFGCLSRAGLGLLPIGVAICGSLIVPRAPAKGRAALVVGALAVLMLLLVVVLPRTAVVGQALARFDAQSDLRYQFWPVVIEGIKTYFPAGSGFGTFQPVFAALEPLSIVKPTYVNHAHSDYLEIALEGGIAGVALIAGFIMWLAATTVARFRVCRPGRAGFAPILIASAGVTELLLHSILDYPLRTLGLAALTSVYCGILATAPTALDLQELSCYRGRNRRRARTGAVGNSPVESL